MNKTVPQWIVHHGWELDQYQAANSKWLEKKWYYSENERLYDELAAGGGLISKWKHYGRVAWNKFSIGLFNRFWYNENRLGGTSDCYQDEWNSDEVAQAVKQAGDNGVNVGEALRLLTRPKVNA